MDSINAWVLKEQDNITNDPSFLVVTEPTEGDVYPWQGLHISHDTVTVDAPTGSQEPVLIYEIYAHLHLMVSMGRGDEWLPEAPNATGFELERAILSRTADAWLLGRTVYAVAPYGPLDELAYAKEDGFLEPFIFTARPDDFAAERRDWVEAHPGEMERYHNWFLDTFGKEPPGLRAS
jgi:hypothetical protein